MKLKSLPLALGASFFSFVHLSAESPATSALPAAYLDDAVLSAEVNFSSIRSSGFYQGLKERGLIDEEDLTAEEFAEIFENTDLTVDSLGRLVINVAGLEIDPEWLEPNPENLRISGALELTTQISAEEFNNFVSNHELAEEMIVSERHGFKIFTAPEEFEDEPQFSLGLFDQATFPVAFFGDLESVGGAFDRAVAGEGELTASLAAAGPVMLGDSNASMLFTLSDEIREMIREGIQQDPMMGGMLRPLGNLQTLGMGVNIDNQVDITIAGQFPSDRDASTLQMSLQGMIAMAMGMAGEIPGGVPAPLQKLEIKAEGPILRITTNLTLEDVDSLVNDLGGMFQF